jgi:hypothetical protein
VVEGWPHTGGGRSIGNSCRLGGEFPKKFTGTARRASGLKTSLRGRLNRRGDVEQTTGSKAAEEVSGEGPGKVLIKGDRVRWDLGKLGMMLSKLSLHVGLGDPVKAALRLSDTENSPKEGGGIVAR